MSSDPFKEGHVRFIYKKHTFSKVLLEPIWREIKDENQLTVKCFDISAILSAFKSIFPDKEYVLFAVKRKNSEEIWIDLLKFIPAPFQYFDFKKDRFSVASWILIREPSY